MTEGRTMKRIAQTLIIASLTVIVLSLVAALVGCQDTSQANDRRVPEVPTRRIRSIDQEPMSYDEYPEWVKKAWIHLVLLPDTVPAPGVPMPPAARDGNHYYVNRDSFDPERKSYLTIENETIFLGSSVYKTTKRDIRPQFECDSEGRGWIFPCTRPGRWHSAVDGLGLSGGIDADDAVKCKHCDRYYLTGRVVFQPETGDLMWSRR